MRSLLVVSVVAGALFAYAVLPDYDPQSGDQTYDRGVSVHLDKLGADPDNSCNHIQQMYKLGLLMADLEIQCSAVTAMIRMPNQTARLLSGYTFNEAPADKLRSELMLTRHQLSLRDVEMALHGLGDTQIRKWLERVPAHDADYLELAQMESYMRAWPVDWTVDEGMWLLGLIRETHDWPADQTHLEAIQEYTGRKPGGVFEFYPLSTDYFVK